MPGKGPLAAPADVVYLYDGSFAGFLCCVYESVYTHQIPAAIYPAYEAQPTMYETVTIETNAEHAARVEKSIPEKISPRGMELVKRTFLTNLADKELCTLRFLLLGYQTGSGAPWMMGHEDVAPLLGAEKHLLGETHLYKGFVRFADYGGLLAASISPKNFVLPFLADHFTERFRNEQFMIYDKTHKAALVYQNRKMEIIPLDDMQFPEKSEEQLGYEALWKKFYKTISIKARENHRCRRSHMPKRYWADMVEMQEYL